MPHGRGGHRGGFRSSRTPQPNRRPPLTHFLCLPLVTHVSRPQLENSLRKFKEQLHELNKTAPAEAMVPLKAIRPIDTIHLTLGVMSLQTDEKLAEALELLESLDFAKLLKDAAQHHPVATSEAQKPDGLEISVQSLLSMHNALNTSILYATVEDSTQRLYRFCEALRKPFADKGLILDENRPLKLHATVVNTIYAKAEIGTVKRLDATILLAEFINYKWTDSFPLEKVAICKMGAKKTFDDHGVLAKEAYEEVAFVELPR